MKTQQNGFTLIELMITLTVLALLATIVLPLAEIAVQRQKEHDLRFALREIRTAIDAYKKASDEGRIIRTVNASGYPRDLETLFKGVPDARDPIGKKMYFLRQVPRDPFFQDTSASPVDTWGRRCYASDPDSPHEGDDVFDVYSLSEAEGLNGVPYRRW